MHDLARTLARTSPEAQDAERPLRNLEVEAMLELEAGTTFDERETNSTGNQVTPILKKRERFAMNV
jgi:hypothetical protein